MSPSQAICHLLWDKDEDKPANFKKQMFFNLIGKKHSSFPREAPSPEKQECRCALSEHQDLCRALPEAAFREWMTGASLGPGQWVHHIPVPPGPSGHLSLTPGTLPAVGDCSCGGDVSTTTCQTPQAASGKTAGKEVVLISTSCILYFKNEPSPG